MTLASNSALLRSGLGTITVRTIFLLAAGGACAQPKGTPAPGLRLSSAQATCLADHAELLLRDKGDPVLFFFDLCDADTAVKGNSRQSLPDLPDLPKGANASTAGAQRADDVPIKVSKAMLRCIQAKKAQTPGFFSTEPVVLNGTVCKK